MNWNPFIKISKNKGLEVNLIAEREAGDWFVFAVQTRTRQDHGGFSIRFEFLTLLSIAIVFYDFRHWDYENDRWCEYDDSIDWRSI